jgi:GLPGLI family protein
MLKQYIFFTVFLSSVSAYCQSIGKTEVSDDTARLKCIYRLTYQPDSTDSFNILTEKSFLLIGRRTSRFQTINSFLADSIAHSPTNPSRITHTINLTQYPKSKFNYIIYKKGDLITTVDDIYIDTYKYDESIAFKWMIQAEIVKMLGYTCQKATTSFAGRRYEAWFTKEVPVSEGPYKFHGLPGLIVKINDLRGHYVFELSSITKPTAHTEIKLPNKRIITSNKADFLKGLATYKANAIDIQAQHGSSYGDLATQKKLYQERLKKRNNPLELR